ncbi:N-formyl peptide receptor 2 [Biomphalaria glabrata]|nr:N-formyl peptide receptor 2-like [Biomphalaria glabrata]
MSNVSNLDFNKSHVQGESLFVALEIFVSSQTLHSFGQVFDTWFSLTVCLVGLVTNVVNIVIFWKMGYRETVNITMSAIALWDVIKVTAGMTLRFYGPISLSDPAFGKSWENITFHKLTYIHVLSGNVSYVMGGYVAIERCLCVLWPFTVRSKLTPKITFSILLAISLVVFGSLSPIMNMFEFRWVYSKDYGNYIAIYDYAPFYYEGGKVFIQGYKILNFLYPMLSLFSMTISSAIIVYQLRKSTEFRLQGFRGERKQVQISSRDKQVFKMLLVVIVCFIASLFPRFVHYTVMLVEPEYYFLKRFHNIFWVVVYIVAFADFLHASLNLFIFLAMSSAFRGMFYSTFHLLRCDGINKHKHNILEVRDIEFKLDSNNLKKTTFETTARKPSP